MKRTSFHAHISEIAEVKYQNAFIIFIIFLLSWYYVSVDYKSSFPLNNSQFLFQWMPVSSEWKPPFLWINHTLPSDAISLFFEWKLRSFLLVVTEWDQFSLDWNLALNWIDVSFSLGENHFSFEATSPRSHFSFELNLVFLSLEATLSVSANYSVF